MGHNNSKLSKEEAEELKSTTYFTQRELQKWHREFMKDCPTGLLGREEFTTIYGQFFPHGDSTKFASLVFNVFDTNGDGLISFKEFISALSITSRGSMEEKLDWAFNLYDIDNDGYITKAEMLQIVESLYSMVAGCSLPAAESAESAQSRVENIFTLMDSNKDGKLSKDEFREGSMRDPWIVQALNMEIPES